MKFFQKILPFVLIFILSFPAFKSLLKPGFYDTHDGLQHLERFIHFGRALENGQIIPRWLPDAFAGYGTPLFNFNWSLPYYLGFFLKTLGLSYQNAFKFLMFISIPLSGIFMFLWLEKKLGFWEGLTSAIFYIYAPYRFLDIYIRGALGEALAFVFIPLVFWAIDSFSSKKSSLFWGSLSFAGLILCHNAFGLVMFVVFISYILFCVSCHSGGPTFFKKAGAIESPSWSLINILKEILSVIPMGIGIPSRMTKTIRHIKTIDAWMKKFKILFFGVGLSAFLWLPAVLEKRFIDFGYKKLDFVPFLSLIRSKWEGGSVFNGQRLIMSFQIGLIQLLVVFLIAFIIGLSKKLKEKKLILFFFFWFFMVIFFLSRISKPVWLLLPLFKNFDFTFRILFLTVTTAAVLAGLLVKNLPAKTLTSLFFISLVIFANRNHLHVLPQNPSMEKLSRKQGSLDLAGEFLPKWTKYERLKEFQEKRQEEVEIVKGENKLLEATRLPLKTRVKVQAGGDLWLRFKRFYFPGWRLFVNGKEQQIFFEKENDRGVIYAKIPKGENEVVLEFKNTLPRTLGNITSLIFLALLFLDKSFAACHSGTRLKVE